MTISTTRHPTAADSIRVFLALLERDLYVISKSLPSFLAQTVPQPFFMLFVFGRVLADLGVVGGSFTQILLPGIIALNAFIGALQATALPLVMDFSYTREIEDRLLAPVSTRLVAIEKIVLGGLRGFLAGVIMIPIGLLIIGGVDWAPEGILPAVLILLLGSLTAAAIGMMMGTMVPPNRIEIAFVLAMTPLMFTGATQFTLGSLENLRWFQVLCGLNPLSYATEGMRAVLLDPTEVASLPLWISVLVLLGSCALCQRRVRTDPLATDRN
jgi:ABC-2 type transport system permease protein